MIYIKKFHDMTLDILTKIIENGQSVFYFENNNKITYHQALYGIYNFIHWLSEHSIVNKRVILRIDNSVKSHLFFLALIHTNDVLLMSPDHTPNMVNYFQNNGFEIIILSEICPELKLDWCSRPTELRPGCCYMLSSGTTGFPEITKLEYHELINYGLELNNYFTILKSDRFFNIVPFYHGFGLTRLFTVIFSGSSQFIPEKITVDSIWNDINSNFCTWASFVPRLINMLSNRPKKFWNGFKFSTSSSSVIDVTSQKKFENISGRPLFIEYGCTEVGIISSNNFESQVYGSLGKNNLPIKIENNTLWVQPRWKNSKEWIDTGDIIEIKNGNLWLLGRFKEIIKKNGKTIFPSEIEMLVNQIPGVDEVVAYSRNTLTDQECIGLVYTGTVSLDQMSAYCNHILTVNLRPDHICHLPSMPYNGNKIRRGNLQEYVDSSQR
jgi:acyl-CoA synthetase (AMP-forming)/AMP-acid ligase II